MGKFFVALLSISLLLTGCSNVEYGGIKAQKKKISELALSYVQEKYNMESAKVEDVSLSSSPNGPIPSLKREVSRSGIARITYNDVSFNVLVSTGWNKFTDKFDNIIADNFQAEDIKAGIQEKIIEQYGVADNYHIRQFEVSSIIGDSDTIGYNWLYRYIFGTDGRGEKSYFTLHQKYDGDIHQFLQENDYSVQLEIFFKGEEQNKQHCSSETKAFFNKMTDLFGRGNSEIFVYVSKEDMFMNEKMQEVLERADNGQNIDPVIYGPVYNYCTITGGTNNVEYIEYAKKANPYSKLKELEVKENSFNYVEIDHGISVASMLDNVEFTNKNDFTYSIASLSESDRFHAADIKALDKDLDDIYEYGLLNDQIYRVSYAQKEYDGREVYWSDPIALKISKSIVEQGIDEVFLVQQLEGGKLTLNVEDKYLIDSEGSLIGPARIDSDFVIAYKKRKQ